MSLAEPQQVEVLIMSGPREGEVLLLPSLTLETARAAGESLDLSQINDALDGLAQKLEQFTSQVRANADAYAEAADRLEQAAEHSRDAAEDSRDHREIGPGATGG